MLGAAGQVAFLPKVLDDLCRIKRQSNVASCLGLRLREDVRKRLVWSFGASHSIGLAKANCATEPKKSFTLRDHARQMERSECGWAAKIIQERAGSVGWSFLRPHLGPSGPHPTGHRCRWG